MACLKSFPNGEENIDRQPKGSDFWPDTRPDLRIAQSMRLGLTIEGCMPQPIGTSGSCLISQISLRRKITLDKLGFLKIKTNSML